MLDHPPIIPAIGLSGFASSGKTTVARHIEQRWGLTRLHIADPLRDMLAPLYAVFGVADPEEYLTGARKEQPVPGIGVTSRQMQISLGTEWGRHQVRDDLWVRAWQERAAAIGGGVMNDSVRFPNEETAIREMGGFTILICRETCEPAAYRWGWIGKVLYDALGLMWGVHPSERIDRLSPDYELDNNSTIGDLLDRVDQIIGDEIRLRLMGGAGHE